MNAPAWNPRVIEAIEEKAAADAWSTLADAYGTLVRRRAQELAQVTAGNLASQRGGGDNPARRRPWSCGDQQRDRPANCRRHLYSPETPTAMSDDIAAKLLNRTVADSPCRSQGGRFTICS